MICILRKSHTKEKKQLVQLMHMHIQSKQTDIASVPQTNQLALSFSFTHHIKHYDISYSYLFEWSHEMSSI